MVNILIKKSFVFFKTEYLPCGYYISFNVTMNYIDAYFYNIFKCFGMLILGVLTYSQKEYFYTNFPKIKSWWTIIPEKNKTFIKVWNSYTENTIYYQVAKPWDNTVGDRKAAWRHKKLPRKMMKNLSLRIHMVRITALHLMFKI